MKNKDGTRFREHIRKTMNYSGQYKNIDVSASFEAEKMTKDIFVHQISDLINSHLDTLMLSVIDIFTVTVYTAYNSVMSYPVLIVNKVINNLRASIGLKLSSEHENLYSIFEEIMSLNFFIASVVTSTFLLMIDKFIILWIGEKFLLDKYSTILLSAILVHKLIINTIYAIRDGKGLYKESKRFTLLTTVSNFLLSVFLFIPFGIKGLLFATVFSTYFIMDLGNIQLIFSKVFNRKASLFLKDFFLLIISIVISVIITNSFFYNILYNYDLSWYLFIIETIISICISTFVITIILIIFNKSFTKIIRRILLAIK